MDEKVIPQTGEQGKGRTGKKIALFTAGGFVGVIVGVYMLLCVWTGLSNTILPGVYAGGVDLGGKTVQQAEQALNDWAKEHYGSTVYTIYVGEAEQEFDGAHIVVDAADIAQRAWEIGRKEPFLQRGAVIAGRLTGLSDTFDCKLRLSDEGKREFVQAMTLLNQKAGTQLVDPVWAVENQTLKISRGITGRRVNWPETEKRLLDAAQTSDVTRVEAVVVTTQPEELNLDEVYSKVHVEPKDAALDPQTYRTADHVVGVDFDLEAAKSRYAELGEGETMRVQLKLTVPEVTKESLNAKLFRDVLGSCETNIGGTANRLNNVVTAAKALDGVVLVPGQVFSYNNTLGPRTVANGYKSAPAYVGGKTVDEIGGGICQGSSTLYMAVLRANLKIVERRNHMYTVGYVPNGMDATVAYNAIDFKFSNNTSYPIRIRATVEGRKLTIKIEGTMAKPFSVKLENETLSTTPYKVVYKMSDSVAPGKTVVETTPYTGCKVRVYRCVYDGNGNLISRTLENTSTYSYRDKVVLCNPADAGKYGLPGGDVAPAPSNPEPAPADPEPAPSNPEPAPSNPEPAPSNPEPAPSNPEPAPSNPEPAPSNPEPAPSNPEPAPSDPEPAPADPEPVPSDPAPAPSNPEPAPTEPAPEPSAA